MGAFYKPTIKMRRFLFVSAKTIRENFPGMVWCFAVNKYG
jgi:hypothetical protein